jgi:uncharacterized membrane protein YraQ (UPF0718 family)
LKNANHTKAVRIISSIISALLLIAFFIFILPVALILVVALIFSAIIIGIIMQFMIKKKYVKMNFVYQGDENKKRNDEEKTMKDVTHSNDS